MSITEQITDPTQRVYYSQSYDLPQVDRNYNFPIPPPGSYKGSTTLFIAPGSVQVGSQVITWSGGYFNRITWDPVALLSAVYVDSASGSIQSVPTQTNSLLAFSNGSFPIAIVQVDAIGRVQNIFDWRQFLPAPASPNYIASASMAGAGSGTLLTAPSNSTARIFQIVASNPAGSPVTINITFSPPGGGSNVLAITVNGNSTATLPPSSVPYVTAAASTAVTYGTTGAMSLTAYFVQP